MSFIETETIVSSDDVTSEVRQRKTARIDESLQLFPKDKLKSRRVCRRYSYPFRCSETETDGSGDEGKHYEGALLVKVLVSEVTD